jgi:3-oxoacyl-[acyl-carrier protein] reductase
VTGGAQGIGRAIAIDFAEEGAAVVICDLNEEKAKTLVVKLMQKGHNAISIKADVTEEMEVEHLVKKSIEKLDKIDILVNNAGGSAREKAADLINLIPNVWQETISRNLHSAFLMTKYILPHMKTKRYGKIINISSEGARAGTAGATDYCAAKAGVIGLTRALAREVADYGVTVNAICPGPVYTEALKRLPEKVVAEIKSKIILGRFGKPEDIAYCASYLASSKSDWVTGQVIGVNGGRFIGG